jgi:hypothetical protein
MMIAISIFAILVLFLMGTTSSLSHSNKLYQGSLDKKLLKSEAKKLIFNDIIKNQKISEIDYSEKNVILELITANTLYNPFDNFVTYKVTSDNYLIRYETSHKKPEVIDSDYIQSARVDILYKDVEKFYVQLSKKKKFILIYIKQKDMNPITFEVALLNG